MSRTTGAQPRIFVPQALPDEAMARLRELGTVDVFESGDRRIGKPELLRRVGDQDILIALGQIAYDTDVLDAAGDCVLIAAMHSLANFVDIAGATERGIVVTGIPADVSKTTAEYTFAMVVGLSWRLAEADRFLRDGRWTQNQSTAFLGSRLFGKTIGIVGMGIVGQGVARRARGFDMDVLYAKRTRLDPSVERELGATRVELDALFRESDIVVLTVSLNPDTHGMVDTRRLASMKPTALLVNTSRGAVIDEAALERALRDGVIAGAALDVFEHEPPDPRPGPGSGLLELPNVLVTPHLGTAARETREEMGRELTDNVAAFIAGDRPPNVLNSDVYSLGALRAPAF